MKMREPEWGRTAVARISHEILVSLNALCDGAKVQEVAARQVYSEFPWLGRRGAGAAISHLRDCRPVPHPASMSSRFRRKHHRCERVAQSPPTVCPRIG